MEKHTHTTDRRRAYSDGPGFVLAATALHKGSYLYDATHYLGAHTLLPINCNDHGVFMQTPTNHMQGKGCPKCAVIRSAQSIPKQNSVFIKEAKDLWGDTFDYSETEYIAAKKYIQFRCVKHGLLLQQTPTNHLSRKNPCPQCNHMASKEEDRIFRLMSIYTQALQRDRTLIKPKELDIYMSERKLAIEYCGMYWHSHFTAEDEKRDKKKHVAKYLACKESGVRLLTIYESEWLEHEYALRRLLRNAAGKSRGKLMARKCELRKIETSEARVFYNKYHPQGGAGAGEHYALFWKEKIVACMRFVLGANDRGTGAAKRTWTLGRYATRITVAGAASRLFKAFLTEFNPIEVKSFSDNRYFDGGMYTQLGFELEADVAPDYQVWSPKIGVRPKSHYQRRVLPKRLLEHGVTDSFDPETDPRTEQDMTFLMGAGRIYDCGKKRWVWTASSNK